MAARYARVGDTQQPRLVRLVHISDTHGRHEHYRDTGRIPPGDVLVHTGDWDDVVRNNVPGARTKLQRFNTFLHSLPHRTKIYVPGNHEAGVRDVWELDEGRTLASLLDAATVLVDRYTHLEPTGPGAPRLRVHGTPWMDMGGWRTGESALAHVFSSLPQDIDLLLTHRPPLYVLDLAWQPEVPRHSCEPCGGKQHKGYRHWGCSHMSNAVLGLPQPRRPWIHCFGHVHDAAGFLVRDGVLFSNAAMDLYPQANIIDIYPLPADGSAPAIEVGGDPDLDPWQPAATLDGTSTAGTAASIADATALAPILNDGDVAAQWCVSPGGVIRHVASGLVLDIDMARRSRGASVILWRHLTPPRPQQLWLERAVEGMAPWLMLTSALNTELVLELDVGSDSVRMNVPQWPPVPHQLWRIDAGTSGQIVSAAGFRLTCVAGCLSFHPMASIV